MAKIKKEKEYRVHLMVCAGTACVSNHSFEIKEALETEIKKQDLDNEVLIVTTGCNGFCERGPLLVVQPGNIFYQTLTTKDIPHLVEEHFLKGRPVEKLMYIPPEEKTPIPVLSDIDFFKKQVLIALRNRGLIDPEKIDEYIARDGYKAMAKALTSMSPSDIRSEIQKSGLRGRGGGGFPTGLKWEFVSNAVSSNGNVKYLVCNGDEGDPGAFMDRSILEADPHSVIEGMVIGAKAINATQGYAYVRNEYPLALNRLYKALDDAREYGLLGKNILGSGMDFDIKIVRGAGAFICGEETALLSSIEGRLGEPKPRPPYPAEKGLWGCPTLINNVETWANIAPIINRGAKWYSHIGTETSKGTKVFSLVGKINNTGLVEVPMGITLREIIYDIGGGIPGGREFKAVQTGGPSGGCIPKEKIDLPIDYESLSDAGSMMGSGGMVVMDEDTCMVDVARYFLSFTQDESCGKCTPCREGTKAMLDILTRITKGEGTDEDLTLLEELAVSIKDSALCGLGKTAPNPVLTTMKYFRSEYEAHIRDKKCPAHTCRDLNVYTIDEDICVNTGHGCDLCRRNCASDAILGERNQPHQIIQDKCTKCGVCYDVCKFGAVKVD